MDGLFVPPLCRQKRNIVKKRTFPSSSFLMASASQLAVVGFVRRFSRSSHRQKVHTTFKQQPGGTRSKFVLCQPLQLGSATVSMSSDTFVAKKRKIIDSVRAQLEYVKWYNAVDRSDCDSADYSTTIRTDRYYIRIMCWALNRFTVSIVVCWFAVICLGRAE